MKRSFAQRWLGQRADATSTAWGADAVLGALVIVIVAMMIVPLPTPLLDLLIAGNLALGVVMMLVALYARDAMSFTALPTVLLVTTLYRLALNVSSTRLILLQADAGTIIRAFGDFVVRGDYLVGAVIFLILTLIQYVVIARGAERVAEVGARFMLDAMPGKQLAIDADLRQGALSIDAANQRRRALERESQLYGAMDGAMKFVKGDAIASIAISLINLVAGAAIGVSARGLDLVTSLKTYGLLTVGDGLVSQIPALLITTSAAIVVTRVASEEESTSLAREIGAQLLGTPRVLWTASALLLVLALVPGLPLLPFGLVALSSAALASLAQRRGRDHAQTKATANSSAQRVVVMLSADLHARVVASDQAGARLQRDVVQAVYEQRGLQLTDLSWVRDERLDGARFKLLIDGALATEGEASSLDALRSQLIDALSRHASLLFGVEHAQRLLEVVAQTQPTLVRSLVPAPLSLATLTLVLARLLEEGVSLRHAHLIFDRLATIAPRESDVAKLAQSARACLQRQLSEQVAPHGTLDAFQLDPLFVDLLRDALTQHTDGDHVALPRQLADDMIAAIRTSVAKATSAQPPVLLTPDRVRRAVHLLVKHELPQLRVIGVGDLSPQVTVNTLSWIGP